MEITFQCKACHTTYSVGEALAGRVGECQKCGQRFTIPYKSPVIKLGAELIREEPPAVAAKAAAAAPPLRGVSVPLVEGRSFEEYEPLRKPKSKKKEAAPDRPFCPLPSIINDIWLPIGLCVVAYGASLFLAGHYIFNSYGVGAGLVIAAVTLLLFWAAVVPLTVKVVEAAADSFGVMPTNALRLQVIASFGLPVYGILFGMFARGTQGAVIAGAIGTLIAALALSVMLQTSAAKALQTALLGALAFACAAAAVSLVVWGVAIWLVPRWGLNLPWVKPPEPIVLPPYVPKPPPPAG